MDITHYYKVVIKWTAAREKFPNRKYLGVVYKKIRHTICTTNYEIYLAATIKVEPDWVDSKKLR